MTDWIMARLRTVTHARLKAVTDSLLRAHEQGKIALDFDAQGRVSLDQVINILVDQRQQHAARRKMAGRKVTAAGKGATSGPPT